MNPLKVTKDYIGKYLLRLFFGDNTVPRELLELVNYFRHYEVISFDYKEEGNVTIAVSTNFRHGSIVASGRNKEELESNIKDAILTSFDLPSAYQQEASIKRVGEKTGEYALA